MAKRGFVCLCCGRQCYAEKEEYDAIRDNPVCGTCQQKHSVASPREESDTDDTFWADLGSMVQRGVNALSKSKSQEHSDFEEIPAQPIPPTIEDSPLNPGRGKGEPVTSSNRLLGQFLVKAGEIISGFQGGDAYSWQLIGCLGDIYDHHKEVLRQYNDCVGLYMHKINGQIMYIGRAVEYNNGGFRKRLSDYCRDSDSARKHPSGQKIYANRYRIQTYIMVVGNDWEAAEKTKLLEKQYVARYAPPWNDKLK